MLVLKYISGFCSKEIFVWTTNSMGPFMRLFQYFTYRYCLNCNPSFTNLDFLELSYCFFSCTFPSVLISLIFLCHAMHWPPLIQLYIKDLPKAHPIQSAPSTPSILSSRDLVSGWFFCKLLKNLISQKRKSQNSSHIPPFNSRLSFTVVSSL